MLKFPSTLDAPITERDLSCFEADKAVVHAIAQHAINVEMFTIPLYMSSLYSLQGMHEINAEGIDYFKGRTWPGMAASACIASVEIGV